MSATDPNRQESTVQDRLDSLEAAVESLTDRVTTIEDTLGSDDSADESATDTDELTHRVDALSRGLSTAHESIETLQERVDGHQSGNDTEGSADQNTAPDTRETAETPLERVVGLPEGMADTELTANQNRARFIAKDVDQYTSSVPAGRAIKSSEIATVLQAGTECDGRSQTVARVIRFLEELGGDGVDVVTRRSERRVVFSEDTARRLTRLGDEQNASHGVVTEVRT